MWRRATGTPIVLATCCCDADIKESGKEKWKGKNYT
jgi:hypothetical protein